MKHVAHTGPCVLLVRGMLENERSDNYFTASAAAVTCRAPRHGHSEVRPQSTPNCTFKATAKMASPAAGNMPNGISAANLSPPTASSAQPNAQTSQQASQLNGSLNPSFPAHSLQDTGNTKRPRDARLVHLILANMGVHAYTERVPLQLLDFAYRYTSGIMSDAIAYEPPVQSSASSKKARQEDEGVSLNALRTAVSARVAQQFSSALPKDFMIDLASERNRIALPRVDREFGLRLPPERYCFTGVGWGLRERWEDEVEVDEVDEVDLGGSGMGSGGPVGGPDTVMGGLEDEDVDENEFEDAMGLGDQNMTNG